MIDDRDLGADVPEAEREALVRIVERMERERPVPAPTFRGNLRRHLLARRSPIPSAAGRFRVWAASYVGLGVLLLAVAAAGLVGAGPFAA